MPHLKVRMTDLGVTDLIFKFSMNFIPFGDLKKDRFECLGYSVTPGVLNMKGECTSYDDEAEEAICKFELTGEFENYYFGLEVNL